MHVPAVRPWTALVLAPMQWRSLKRMGWLDSVDPMPSPFIPGLKYPRGMREADTS